MSLYPLLGALILHLSLSLVGSVVFRSVISSVTLFGGFALAEILFGAIVLVAVGLGAAVRRRADSRLTRGPALPALVLSLTVVYPLLWVGAQLASGPWIASQSWAPAVQLGPSLAGALGMFIGAWIFLAWPAHSDPKPLRRRALTGLALAGMIVAVVADAKVMPGLYPEFHLAALAIAALFALIASQRLLANNTFAERWGAFASILLIIPGTLWLTMSRTVRAELLLHSSSAATLIRNTSPLPPKTYLHEALVNYDEFEVDEGPELPRGKLTIGDDWNIILITVDTLRGDVLPPVRTGEREFAQEGDTPFLDSWIEKSFRFTRAYSHATMTHRSMPATFRSLEAYENPRTIGLPISTYMAQHGRTPIALANNYFLEPRFPAAQALLDGFQSISIYEKADMRDQVTLARELLDDAKDRPFFAWIHFYCMHWPGYDERMLEDKDGSWPVRYRASLRWLDREMAKLIAAIDDLGLTKKTVIFFTSDHGEGIGDHNSNHHGPTVFDPEVRIPIVIYIPGQDGAEIDATVGNIDIVPTMTDLLGLPADINHRGKSMVPLLADPTGTPWNQDYYVENSRGSVVALIHDGNKLIYDVKGDSIYRFDLEEDPEELTNLYIGDVAEDRDMVRRLLHRSPQLFAEELDNEATRELLRDLLATADANAPSPLLLRLLALAPEEIGMDEAFRIFDETESEGVRLQLLHLLQKAAPKEWHARLTDYVKSIAGTPAELHFAKQLAFQGQGPFNRQFVADRLAYWSKKGAPDEWVGWLRVVKPWPYRSIKGYGKALTRMMVRAIKDPTIDAATTELVLETVATLGRGQPLSEAESRTSSGERELAKAALPFLDHPEPSVRRAACEGLATVDEGASLPQIRVLVDSPDIEPRIRQAALGTLVALEGSASIPTIARLADDPLLGVDCIDHLRRLDDPAGLPTLNRIRKDHYNHLVRARAKKAAKAIRDSQKKKREEKKEGKAKEKKEKRNGRTLPSKALAPDTATATAPAPSKTAAPDTTVPAPAAPKTAAPAEIPASADK